MSTHVRPGPDHRIGHPGRPHPLNDPEFARKVAEAFAAGESRKSMAEMFAVKDLQTITRWRRDPRVKVHAFKIIEDRVLQVTRKVDAKIAYILENCDDLTVNELLAIRKEFLGGAMRSKVEATDEGTIGEAQEFMERNPDAVQQLEDMFSGRKTE